MEMRFKQAFKKEWILLDDKIIFDKKEIFLSDITKVVYLPAPNWSINIVHNEKATYLFFGTSQSVEAKQAFEYIEKNSTFGEKKAAKEEKRQEGLIYEIKGVRGRSIAVYEDRCVITTKVTAGSLLTGNATDGEKTIYYSDCIGVQFRKSGLVIGYLQLETASSTMNNKSDNHFNENSFTFDTSTVSNEKMEDVADYVKSKVEEFKRAKNAPITVTTGVSSADELKKFKELFDMGVITQEEFDLKKKQLLGL